jgi:hypothetical protein
MPTILCRWQEERLYAAALEQGITCMTVSQRLSLPQVELMPGSLARKTPSWPRSWANFSLFIQPFIAVSPQDCMGQLTSFGPT